MKKPYSLYHKNEKHERIKEILCAVFVIAGLALCAWFHFNTPKASPVWTDSYPMANAGMQWAYTSDPRCQP